MAKIGESTIEFAVYEDKTEFLGLAEVTLPSIAQKTIEVSGSGVAGSYNSPIPQFDPMTTTINFSNLVGNTYMLMEPRMHMLDIRQAIQSKNRATGQSATDSVKHVLRVRPTKTELGKIASASKGDPSGEFETYYIATYENGEKKLEIDVENGIYFVNGIDYMAAQRAALGK